MFFQKSDCISIECYEGFTAEHKPFICNHTDSGIFWEAFERSHGRIPLPQECQRFEDDFQTRYDTITQHTAISEVEGASTLLKALASHDQFFVAFATGSYRGAAEHKLKRLGVTTHDEVPLVTASEFKTRQEIVSAAASFAISAGVNKIVSVGDGPWDYKTAQDLNYDFVGIGAKETAERLRLLGAEHIFSNFSNSKAFIHLLLPKHCAIKMDSI